LRPERRRKTREMAWKGIQQWSIIIVHTMKKCTPAVNSLL
jgi:hypothetical protein